MGFLNQVTVSVERTLASFANVARVSYDLAFQVSPILLQGGIAGNQGHILPIIALTGGGLTSLDEAFAHYLPLPGSTLIRQSVALYPFANQAIAANATITEPLTISLAMIAPVNQPGGYIKKLQQFSALQASLAQHNALGGTYIVATPAFIYQNLLLTAMTDSTPEISAEGNQQVQIQWTLDFIQPILTQGQADTATSAFIQRVTNGNRITGVPSWSGNTSSSPANLTGITGALGNVASTVSSFGGSLVGGL